LQYLNEALAVAPQRADILINLGLVLTEMGKLEEAETTLIKAVSINPQDPDGYCNLGNCLRLRQRPIEALQQYKKALALAPNDPDIHLNIGVVLRDLLYLDEAISHYRRAIELKADHAETHFNLALALLMKGQYKEGWQEYQWRWKTRDFIGLTPINQNRWDGRAKGIRLLLRAEQGLGDTIQFVRYAKTLSQWDIRVILQCQGGLVRLLEGQCNIKKVIHYDEPYTDFDYQYMLLDLPLLLQTDTTSIPSEIPYISAKAPDVTKWEPIFNSHCTKKDRRVGLVWRGSKTNLRGRYRSMCISDIEALLSIKDIKFFHIGKEDLSAEIQQLPSDLRPIDLSGQIGDFSDTAAIIHHLDLVITIDTAVAHLAGAMGKPVWLMLHYSSDWRWLIGISHSPWYPTMTIFRQNEFGNWQSVINEIVRCLRGHTIR